MSDLADQSTVPDHVMCKDLDNLSISDLYFRLYNDIVHDDVFIIKKKGSKEKTPSEGEELTQDRITKIDTALSCGLYIIYTMVDKTEKQLDSSKDWEFEINTSPTDLLKHLREINIGNTIRSSQYSKIYPLIFTNLKELYEGKIPVREKLLEDGNADSQCNNVFGNIDKWTNADCYICGNYQPSTQSNKATCSIHCEHVLNIFQSMISTQLYYRGLADDEEVMADLKNITYSHACACCNYIKNNKEFIYFDNGADWSWKVRDETIKECLKSVQSLKHKCCKSKKDIYTEINIDERTKNVKKNMEERCRLLNDHYKPRNPSNCNEETRKTFYSFYTAGNILLSFRPESITKIIESIINKKKKKQSSINKKKKQSGGRTTIENATDNTEVVTQPIATKQTTKTLNPAKNTDEALVNEVVKHLQIEIEHRQKVLDKIFEHSEKIYTAYQKANPDVVDSDIRNIKLFLKQQNRTKTSESKKDTQKYGRLKKTRKRGKSNSPPRKTAKKRH